ncbi:MAG: zinc ribbon domain-containing protein [Planctomycetota bacterium]
MPVYVYQVVRDRRAQASDGLPGHCFEVMQPISDPSLTRHPVTGQPVTRIVQRVGLAGQWSEAGMKQGTRESNLTAHGFAKYIKVDDGRYEKMSGEGPKTLSSE